MPLPVTAIIPAELFHTGYFPRMQPVVNTYNMPQLTLFTRLNRIPKPRPSISVLHKIIRDRLNHFTIHTASPLTHILPIITGHTTNKIHIFLLTPLTIPIHSISSHTKDNSKKHHQGNSPANIPQPGHTIIQKRKPTTPTYHNYLPTSKSDFSS